MKTIFADTYYFLAIGNERDEGHLPAVKYAASYQGTILTTDWVLTEVADALASPGQREQFIRLLELIKNDPNWIVVEASRDLFRLGVSLFSQRYDKAWSLTDCISFVVMQERGIEEALTADHHFQQAGFVALFAG